MSGSAGESTCQGVSTSEEALLKKRISDLEAQVNPLLAELTACRKRMAVLKAATASKEKRRKKDAARNRRILQMYKDEQGRRYTHGSGVLATLAERFCLSQRRICKIVAIEKEKEAMEAADLSGRNLGT